MKKATWRIENKPTQGKKYVLVRNPKIFLEQTEDIKYYQSRFDGYSGMAFGSLLREFLVENYEKHDMSWYSVDEIIDFFNIVGLWIDRDEAEFMATENYLKLRKELLEIPLSATHEEHFEKMWKILEKYREEQ